MHKYITLFFSVMLFLSCGGDTKPKGIIDKKKMTSLLMEVHLIDGRMYGIFQSQDSVNKYGTARYDALFKRFHTDSSTFIRSLKYYARKPDDLQKMYVDIVEKLRIKSDSLNKVQHETDSVKRAKLQKINTN